MHRPLAPAAALTLALAAAALAATYDTPEKAAEDPDFKVQGEYVGDVTAHGETMRIGFQIIALGDGNFRAVNFEKGLPGETGSKRDGTTTETKRADDVVEFKHPSGRERIVYRDGHLDCFVGDQKIASLPRVQRTSPTLGAQPPAGATALFDGTEQSLAHWHGGKITDDGLLMQGVTSKPTFGDCTVHIEFRLPYKPDARDQGRGNSGIYVQGRYEIQMLDSFGLEGKNNECGGIYSIAAPAVNMCYPPLAWQTYDIDFTAARFDDAGNKTANARVTVRHNGVMIHDDVELTHATTASKLKEGPEPGPIYLQDHGNPVRYRNVWVLPKSE